MAETVKGVAASVADALGGQIVVVANVAGGIIYRDLSVG